MILTTNILRRHLHYAPSTGTFTRLLGTHKGTVTDGKNRSGHVRIYVAGVREYAHRLAWLYMKGSWPVTGIDHRDGVPSNNAWGNLRLATNKQNQENWTQRRATRSGIRGVTWNEPAGRWVARIHHNGQRMHLGYFYSKEDATVARKTAEHRLYTHHPLQYDGC